MKEEEWDALLAIREEMNANLMAQDVATQERFTELLVKSLEGKGDLPIGGITVPSRTGYPLCGSGETRYNKSMENDLYTYTFCREDWERIMGALRATAITNYNEALEMDRDSVYGAALYQEGDYCRALADDIDFKLPD
jgi:hypothetical protein